MRISPSDVARDRVAQILDAVGGEPKCPCRLADELDVPERELYPVLAVMMAADVIELYPAARFAGSKSGTDREIESMLEEMKDLQANGGVLMDLSGRWLEFFRHVGSMDPQPVYFIMQREEHAVRAAG